MLINYIVFGLVSLLAFMFMGAAFYNLYLRPKGKDYFFPARFGDKHHPDSKLAFWTNILLFVGGAFIFSLAFKFL